MDNENPLPDVQAIQNEFRSVQDSICDFVSREDGRPFREDAWAYEKGSGGGLTRVWQESELIEKGGVNYSAIQGESLPATAATQFQLAANTPFLATGLSLVLHPQNPHVPTIHMNIRYFEAGDVWWFGGGVDVTPYYPQLGTVVDYHRRLKKLCEDSGEDYAQHKNACDAYFYLSHRKEHRGVGGLFFDHMRQDKAAHFNFVSRLGRAFPRLWEPFLRAGSRLPYDEKQRRFQLHRRSRYVEFNLIYDRGTQFGLQSGGRAESILMSLPRVAHWDYDYKPAPGSREEELTRFYLKPQDWLGMEAPDPE